MVLIGGGRDSFAHLHCNDLFKLNPSAKKESSFELDPDFQSRYFLHLDGANPASSEILAAYQKFQSRVFENRLQKYKSNSSEKTDALRELDFLYQLRSHYMILFKSNQNREIIGGIRAVYARSSNEKLPFEDDLKIQRVANQKGYHSVEIGRLTNLEPTDALYGSSSLTALMIELILRKVLEDPSVEWIYVHTSANHVRLYRLFGYVPDNVENIDSLNQVLQFSAQNLKKKLNL